MIDPNDKSFRGAIDLSATSTTLLRQLRQDDPAAWERLAEKYLYAIYRWARRAGLSAPDAQDVTQEVFQSALQSLPNFQKKQSTDTFRGWLRRITQRRIADRYRELYQDVAGAAGGSNHLGRLRQVALPPETPRSQVTGPQAMVREAISAVRRHCKEQNWEMFSQLVFDERSPEEVAKAFGVACSQVYNIKCRYLRRLRQELARRGLPGHPATEP